MSSAAPRLASSPPPLPAYRRLDPRLFLLLLLTIPWWLALPCPFLRMDDPAYITENPHIRGGLSLPGLSWAFSSSFLGFYLPITWLSLMLDVSLFGLHPAGMHATNILFHTASTFLLYAFLGRTTGNPWRAFLVAALFSIHPLRVESVVWITERKDVLAVFFGLCALLAYTAYTRAASPRRILLYALALAALALSLLSKPLLVTFPFLLLLLDAWPLRRLHDGTNLNLKTLLLEKIPFLIPCLAITAITFLIHQRDGVFGPGATPFSFRLGNAALSCLYYLRDIFYFQHLSLFYPPLRTLPAAHLMLALTLLAALTAAALWRWRPAFAAPSKNRGSTAPDHHRAPLIGWLWFLGTLIPMLGILQSGTQSRADRFTYWPSIGLFIALVYLWPPRWFVHPAPLKAARLLAGGILITLSIYTSLRILLWRDPLALYLDGIAHTRHNALLKSLVAAEIHAAGNLREAEAWYMSSLTDSASLFEPNLNYALLLQQQQRWDDALFHLDLALRINPNSPEARAAYQHVRRQIAASQPAATRALPPPPLIP